MSKLPSGYTELEYIQSSGTQYINTGVVPTPNSRAVIDAQITAQTTATVAYLGERSGSGSSDKTAFALWSMGTGANVSSDFFGNRVSKTMSTIGTRVLIDKNKASVTINGSTITNSAAAGTATLPIFLFAINEKGTSASYKISARLYACQIYDNGTLIRNFIPCKNASGVVGLYDTVGAQFYANAGTGTFTAGPEILPPAAPTALQTVLAVVLQWAASENADRYDVYRDGAKLGSTEGTQYVDTTPEANQTYVYTVKAVNGGGESAGTSITVYTRSGYFEYKPLIESANFP